MKKILKNKIVYVFLLLVMMVGVLPAVTGVTYAAGDTANIAVTNTDIDENLHNKLSRVHGNKSLKTNTFNDPKYETIAINGSKVADTSTDIVDVTGLKKFYFGYTKTLDLSDNSITEIPAEVFDVNVFPALETLILSGNDISSINLSGCYKLKNLIADNNEIKEINVSDMSATNAVLDLSANYIDDFSNITLPDQVVDVNMTIKLYNNNISDFENAPTGYQVYLGIQGLRTNGLNRIEKKQKVTYFKTDDSQKMKIVIGGDANISIIDSEMTDAKTVLPLDMGSYTVSYYYLHSPTQEFVVSTKDQPVVAENADYKQDFFRYYRYSEFDVVPSTPTYKYIIDGKEYNEIDIEKITKKSEIIVTSDEGTEVYYKYDYSNDWEKGSTIPITRGGKYFIQVKAVTEDGEYTSESINIMITASVNLKLPDMLLLVLIILGSVALFAGVYFLLKRYVL